MTGNDTEFARWMRVNKSTVSRARKAGRLVLTADGRVDFEASAAKWHDTAGGRTDVAARHAANRGVALPESRRAEKNQTAAHNASDAGQGDGSGSDETRRSAKAASMHYENAQIKLDMALRRGMRVFRKDEKREAHGLGAMLRAAGERLADQTAPRIAATEDPAQRLHLIATEVQRLGWVIKRELPRALRRMKDATRIVKGDE